MPDWGVLPADYWLPQRGWVDDIDIFGKAQRVEILQIREHFQGLVKDLVLVVLRWQLTVKIDDYEGDLQQAEHIKQVRKENADIISLLETFLELKWL